MDFSPADLFRSTKTGSRSSLDRVNKQLSASRGTFRQKVHIGVLLATLALVAYGAIIIWSASQFKADASFSRHLLASASVRCLRCSSAEPICAASLTSRRHCSSSTSL